MSWFFAHLALALLWSALLGSYDLATILSGFVVGLIVLRITLKGPSELYRKRVFAILRFALFYLKEIFVSNLRIASDLFKPQPTIKPGIVAVRIGSLSRRSSVVVANLITMTPGTLSLDISEDGKLLFVHCLYLQDPDATRKSMERDYVDAIATFQSTL